MGGHIRGVSIIWQPQKALGYTWSVFQPGEKISACRFPIWRFALGEGIETKRPSRHPHQWPIPEVMQKPTAMGWHTMQGS